MMSWIFISMLGLGLLLLLLSVVLFVVWRVPSLLEELTGRRGKKPKEKYEGSISGGLTGGEYYKEMMSHNASLVDSTSSIQHEGHTDFGTDSSTSENINNSSNLAKLINDPYGQVWGKTLKDSQVKESVEIEENKPVGTYQRVDKQDDLATEMLDESSMGLKHKIFIIEEQSSLDN